MTVATEQQFVSLEKRVHMLEKLAEDAILKHALPPSKLAQSRWKSADAAKEPYKFKLSARSYRAMDGLHPDAIALIERAIQITEYDFGVTEGKRTAERQRKLLASGASSIKVSYHQLCLAWDVVVYDEKGQVTWDLNYYIAVAEAFEQAAKELDIPIAEDYKKDKGLFWGGKWERLVDGPHYQLNKYEPYCAQQ